MNNVYDIIRRSPYYILVVSKAEEFDDAINYCQMIYAKEHGKRLHYIVPEGIEVPAEYMTDDAKIYEYTDTLEAFKILLELM